MPWDIVSLVAICCAFLKAPASAEPLPRVAPERAGFSKEGLNRIDKFFEREIAADRVPGAVVAIARDGKLEIRNQIASIEPQRDGYGFGLGVAVRLQDGVAAVPGSRGDYTWNGS